MNRGPPQKILFFYLKVPEIIKKNQMSSGTYSLKLFPFFGGGGVVGWGGVPV